MKCNYTYLWKTVNKSGNATWKRGDVLERVHNVWRTMYTRKSNRSRNEEIDLAENVVYSSL